MKNEDSNLNDPLQSMALFAELNPEPVIRFDKSGKILQSNPAANELFEKEEMVETWITEVLPECRKADLEKIIEADKIETFTVKLQGKYYNFLFRGISKFDVCQIYGFDINDKINAQREAESMALFAQKNPAPVFRFDFNGEVKQSNEAADELFKDICKEKVNVFNLFTDLNRNQVKNMIENNEIESFVKRIKDSHYRFELRGISELDSVQVYGADITEIVNAQFENEKLSTAVQQSSNTVMITDTSGNIEFVNKAFEKITGYSRHEVIGYNPRFLQTGYHNKEFYNELWNTINNGEVWKGEFYNRRKDGAEYWEEASISPIFDRNDRIRNFIAVKEDVTEKKKAQEQIQSMALFAKLNPEPVIRFDKNGEILQANPAANESFSMESIEGMQIKDLISELKDINIPEFIENNQIETVDITNHDKTYRFILKGIQEIEVCQIYGSDITNRVKAEQKVRQQKKDIDDSIHYASRIQTAVLPSADVLDDFVQDHFILFKPRDVVSGDFYWMKEKDNKLVLVAADCTGHGVPGAFMSMLGVSFLNEIVNKNQVTNANTILDELRYLVKSTLSHSKEQKADGMDISLVIIDKQNMKMQFAGAYNHLYLFRDKELQVIKADRMPIGNYVGKERPFTNHELDLKKGDAFYLLSDGFPDQFDEYSKKKFSIKRLKEVFSEIHTKPMDEQKKYLEDTFYKWKGSHWQMDDVLITGIRI